MYQKRTTEIADNPTVDDIHIATVLDPERRLVKAHSHRTKEKA